MSFFSHGPVVPANLVVKMVFVLNVSLLTVGSSLSIFPRLQDDPPTGVTGAPTENNIMLWNAVIFG